MGRKELRCYNCGGEVIVGENSHIGICSCCMAEVPIPTESGSIMEAYSQANGLLSQSRFEEAREAFREILVRAPLEAAACWGMAVSEYGIEFVQDPATAELLPTLHRLSLERFSKYLYVKKAVEYAPDYDTQQFYINQSKLIDSIQSRSLQISQKEDPYDVFICYKKTEEGEKRTPDSRMAADLYKELIRRGYKTFFAEETLRVGEEYEPRIFAALRSAKVMIAVGSKEQYYEAVWVKNEWSRYVDLIRTDQAQGKQDRLLIPVFYGIQHDQLPEALRQMSRYVDMSGSDNPKQVLFGLISAHFSGGSRSDASDLRRQVRGQSTGAIRMEVSAENYITRGTIELVNGNFAKAKEMFRQANAMAPSPDGYLGLMMCDQKIPGKEALHQYGQDIRNHPLYRKALASAAPDQREEIEKIGQTCYENQQWNQKCASERGNCDAAAGKVIDAVADFGLDTETHRICRNMDSLTFQILDAINGRQREGKFAKSMRILILLGNLFPALCLMASNAARSAGWDSPIDWISMPGIIAMVICYIVCMVGVLSIIPFLNGGAVSKIIRGVIGYICSMLLIQALNSSEARLIYLGASALAAVLYFLIYGRKRAASRSKLEKGRKEAAKFLKQVPELEQKLRRETMEVLSKATAQHQQFYLPKDWSFQQEKWETQVRDACAKQMERLHTKLNVAQAGKVVK